ncbi:M23 family metallopeptidase [Bauldia sp.]|uniref:M23 family metallopeptidase n=1 Tax=Bauldia sp. TaxID=2575872 RepID=UPI003BACC7C9
MATGYLVFRDDLLAASVARQVRLQQAYEDRIASLRADIDRLTSRQMLNQEAFEVQLSQLIGRQDVLDARQDVVAGLREAASKAGLLPGAATPLPRPRPTLETDPITTGSIVPNGEVRLATVLRGPRSTDILPPKPLTPDQVDGVESSLDSMARNQVAYVVNMAVDVSERNVKIAEVLEDLGHMPAVDVDESAMGGPLEPLPVNIDPDTFAVSAETVAEMVEDYGVLRQRAVQLPIANPVPGARTTSRFGMRRDPFTRRPAMHSGIDFKAVRGHPVLATASGRVTKAARNGGYGYMIEIDHGRGIKTRYAHLNKMLVKRGAYVSAGTVIGQVGSTGRSTGPHLHYEVRKGSKATNPLPYIQAGNKLLDLL